jgi:hypothetical protein
MPRSPRRHHYYSSIREFCDEIKMPDMNLCNEVLKYMSILDLYKYFGKIPSKSELINLQKNNIDEFLELLELMIINEDVDKFKTILKLTKDEILKILIGAARMGHINIVHEMIRLSATNFDRAMVNAAYSGHMDIAQEIMAVWSEF